MTAAAVLGVLAGVTVELRLGGVTVSAVVTAVGALLCTTCSPMLLGARAALPAPAVLFLALALVRTLAAPDVDGLQNTAAYAILLLGPGFVARRADPVSADCALRWFAAAGVVATAVFAAQQAAGVLLDGVRSYALATLPFLAAAVAVRDPGKLLRWAPVIMATGIVASLSRTATVVAVLVLVGLVTRRPRDRRPAALVTAAAAVAAVGAAVWTFVPAFRERFVEGDNASVNGVSINTSGRARLWDAVAEHARSAPLFGHGPGSAARLVTETFPGVRQPHNDWLRILHDTGWIGVVLFALAVGTLLVRVARAARATDAPVHWAALSALAALLATAVTDNTLIYPFAIGSTAVLVGLSLGTAPRTGAPTATAPSPHTTTTQEGSLR